MKKKAVAPGFLIGLLLVIILLLVLIVAFVGPGSNLGNSFLNTLFGSKGCSSPVLIADEISNEINANHLKQAAELYNQFKECHPKLDVLEINENINKLDLDRVIEIAENI